MKSNCKQCGVEFNAPPSDFKRPTGRHYCSRACYNISIKASQSTCISCGSKFKGNPNQKYCNSVCYFSNRVSWNKGRTGTQPKLLGENHPGIKKRMSVLNLTWNEYTDWRKNQKTYYREVWRITNQQPLQTLENFESRGRAGIEGAYHLDHIVSISEGFKKKIAPEIIGGMENLKFITWEDNLKKRDK